MFCWIPRILFDLPQLSTIIIERCSLRGNLWNTEIVNKEKRISHLCVPFSQHNAYSKLISLSLSLSLYSHWKFLRLTNEEFLRDLFYCSSRHVWLHLKVLIDKSVNMICHFKFCSVLNFLWTTHKNRDILSLKWNNKYSDNCIAYF